MKTEEIVGLIEALGKFLVPLGSMLLLTAFVYVLWRTGSGHLLRHRLWRLIYGKEVIRDEVVRCFVEDRTSLMAFRYNAGISVRSLESARRLARWLNKNDEDIGAIKTAGPYFDVEELRLKPASKATLPLNALVLVAFVGCLLVIAFNLAGLSQRGYFRLKDSGQWFSATSKDVQSVSINPWGDRASLTSDLCHKKPAATGGFSKHDAPLLCSILDEPDMAQYLTKVIREQRMVAILLTVIFAIGVVWAIMNIRQLAFVKELELRLQAREAQMTLDFSQR